MCGLTLSALRAPVAPPPGLAQPGRNTIPVRTSVTTSSSRRAADTVPRSCPSRLSPPPGAILAFLKATQNCVSDAFGLRGGVKGSHPFDGEYGRYEVLNWATKFFVDALLLDETKGRTERARIASEHPR